MWRHRYWAHYRLGLHILVTWKVVAFPKSPNTWKRDDSCFLRGLKDGKPVDESWVLVRFIGKDFDAGRDWGQEEKGTAEDEMAGWHHWLDGRESEWTPGVGELVCCDSWGRKESDTTEWLNWTELTWRFFQIISAQLTQCGMFCLETELVETFPMYLGCLRTTFKDFLEATPCLGFLSLNLGLH